MMGILRTVFCAAGISLALAGCAASSGADASTAAKTIINGEYADSSDGTAEGTGDDTADYQDADAADTLPESGSGSGEALKSGDGILPGPETLIDDRILPGGETLGEGETPGIGESAASGESGTAGTLTEPSADVQDGDYMGEELAVDGNLSREDFFYAEESGTDGTLMEPAYGVWDGETAGEAYETVRKYGTVTYADASSCSITVRVSGSYTDDNGHTTAYQEDIIFHIPEGVPILDAASGIPMSLSELDEGDYVYVWSGNTMTLSLPAQMTAVALVVNPLQDTAAPQYAEVSAIEDVGGGSIYITDQDGTIWLADGSTEVSPFKTRQIVTLSDISVGSRLFIWQDEEASASAGYMYRAHRIVII